MAAVLADEAPRCPGDGFSRYRDCGDGTMLDTLTGLVWLKQASCLGAMDWDTAQAEVAELAQGNCGLTDRSFPDDWRLPSAAEWRATLADARAMKCTGPALTDASGDACYGNRMASYSMRRPHDAHAGFRAENLSRPYWSSSTAPASDSAIGVELYDGTFGEASKSSNLYVWPVRGGY